MLLTELTKEYDLMLQIQNTQNSVDVKVDFVQIFAKGILVTPAIVDNKIIKFDDKMNYQINLYCLLNNEKPIIWRNIHVKNFQQKGINYLYLQTNRTSIPYNRRDSFRLDLDITGSLENYGNVLIHDISNKGISFYLKNDKACTVDQKIKLNFIHKFDAYSVKGKVVRIQPDNTNNRTLYGCEMKPSPKIDTFIQEEQRARIRGK